MLTGKTIEKSLIPQVTTNHPKQKLRFCRKNPCFLRLDALGSSKSTLQKSAALKMITLRVTLGEGLLLLKWWCKQISSILRHTAENTCSLGKESTSWKRGPRRGRISQALFIYHSKVVLVHANVETCCSLILAASMLASFKRNPIEARTALEKGPV